ncbi:MAG: transcription antitermination factor NusB [Lachnospiraceae bacterium]|nr:transcription antitermination factor NusB [Lachnospiraceae bacterium]
MKRSELREHTFRTLFRAGFFAPEEWEEQGDLYTRYEGELSGEEDAFGELSEEDAAQVKSRAAAVWEKREDLDRRIGEVSEGWRVERMSRVDLTLLRLGLYEMLYDDSVPYKVAINEAVELAKKYGGDDSFSFVNGILGRLARETADE